MKRQPNITLRVSKFRRTVAGKYAFSTILMSNDCIWLAACNIGCSGSGDYYLHDPDCFEKVLESMDKLVERYYMQENGHNNKVKNFL